MILAREGSSQLLLVGHDGPEDHLLGFLDGALQASACRVFVASAVEELLRHLAAVEPIARTEADAYDLVLLGVLAQRDGEFEFFDLLRDVDHALQVAPDKLETSHFVARDGVVGRMGGRQDAQFLEDHIGPELDGLWRVVVIDAVIDAVFVHALLQQVADDEIDGWCIGVVGEGPRVRHHAAVDTLRHLQRHLVVGAQLPQQAEDEFRRARHRGMGDGERRLDGRAHMVVDEQSGRLRLGNDVRHVPRAREVVVVETADEVGLVEGLLRAVGMLVVAEQRLRSWEPHQEVGSGIGDHAGDLLAQGLQILRPGQHRSDGISVGRLMDCDYHKAGTGSQLPQQSKLTVVQKVDFHVEMVGDTIRTVWRDRRPHRRGAGCDPRRPDDRQDR